MDIASATCHHLRAMGRLPKQPFYGVDGNPLVEDLPHDFEAVEAILNGTFKAEFWAQQFLPTHLFMRFPQLKDERAKRTHRKAYREKWELWKKVMKAKRELTGR